MGLHGLLLSIGAVTLAATPRLASAHGPTAGDPPAKDPPSVQRPSTLDSPRDPPTTKPGKPEKPDDSLPESPDSAGPPPTGEPSEPRPDDALPNDPRAPGPAAAVPAPGVEVPAPDGAAAETSEPPPEIDANLLAPSAEETGPITRAPPPSTVELPATERSVVSRYRPPHNPGRFALVAHGLFANVGSKGSGGGRMGGASVDVGQSWNPFGYALTVSAFGGRVTLKDLTDVNMLMGAGPTIGLGRLPMIGRGVLDLRVGYDFNIARGTFLDPTTGLSTTQTYAPHGPRVRLSMAINANGPRTVKHWHAAGLSIGWQAQVHDLRGNYPFSNMLTLGIVYWLG